MEINRTNYEAFLLDLLEGKLSPEEKQSLRVFLKKNPDCALAAESFDPWILEKETLVFPGKEELKKEIPHAGSRLSEKNFDLFSIARLEGDLTPEQKMEHEAVLEKDPQNRREWMLWQQTKLQATPLEYAGKAKLKKGSGSRGRIIWITTFSAAAAVALLFALLRMEPELPETKLTEQIPSQLPLAEDSPSELPSPAREQEEESLAVADEPVLFSIKKIPDRPIKQVEKGQAEASESMADSIQVRVARKITARPVSLASYKPYSQELVPESAYDRIKPLDLPPANVHMRSLSLAQIAEMDLQEAFDDYTEERNISLWNVANAGIKGINRLTGSEISLLASRDEEGEVSGIQLKSRRFSFTRPIDRSDEYAE